jgi:hypothetical protein
LKHYRDLPTGFKSAVLLSGESQRSALLSLEIESKRRLDVIKRLFARGLPFNIFALGFNFSAKALIREFFGK